jgi:membrane protein implicated in regulation of membrane protease activity
MSYRVEWMGGGVVYGIVLLLLIVPEFAAIAVVVATIAVLVVALAALVVALAALVGLVVLAAAALASPYLLVRSVRRRLCPTRNTIDPLAEGDPEPIGRRIACGLGREHVTAFAQDEPDEAGAILEAARRYPA